MSFIRPWLMGDAYVAVGDESSTLFYNPAGLAGLKENSAEVFNPQISGDRRVKAAILEPEALEGEFEGVDQEGFEDRLGETLYFSFNMRLPSIVHAKSGWAYAGVLCVGDAVVERTGMGQGAEALHELYPPMADGRRLCGRWR